MFCKFCGAELNDNAKFCTKCGANLQTAEQTAQPTPAAQNPQPTPAAQNPQFNLSSFASFKKYTPLISVVMAAIALIFGILTLFGLYDVTAHVSAMGINTSNSGPVADLIEGDGMGMLVVGNILFGLILIAIAAIGGLYFARKFGINYYNVLTKVPFITNESPLFFMGAIGAIGAIIHVICFLLSGSSETFLGITASVSVGAPWFTWVILVVFAAVAAVDKFVFNKKK